MKDLRLTLILCLLTYFYSGYIFEGMIEDQCVELGKHKSIFSSNVIQCTLIEPSYKLKE